MSGKYDDILYLPHHVSPTRQGMTMAERAPQFSPFAALVGYGEAIRETSRAVGQQMELSEEEKAVLDQKQQIILAALEQGEEPEVTVTYFQPDRKKDGGEYVSYTGSIKKYKEIENTLVFGGGKEIPLSGIVDLTGTVFQGHFDD